MATIRVDGGRVPLRVLPQSDGRILVSARMLCAKFGFSKDFIFLEEEVYEDNGESSYSIHMEPSKGDDVAWILKSSQYCVQGVLNLSQPTVGTSVSECEIVKEIPSSATKSHVIKLDDNDTESALRNDMPASQDSLLPHTTSVLKSPFESNSLNRKPPLPPISTDPIRAVSCIQKLQFRKGAKSELIRLDLDTF